MCGLTKDDVKALKLADEVHARRTGGKSQLEAVKHNRQGSHSVFGGGGELRRVIPTREYTRWFMKNGSREIADRTEAFAFSIGSRYLPEWLTIVSLLREHDEVTLEWSAGDTNGFLRAASGVTEGYQGRPGIPFNGLCQDRLMLHVRRNGKPKYCFQLADSIAPVDSTARMIRV